MERPQTPYHDEVLENLRKAQADGKITPEQYREYADAYLHTVGAVAIIGSQTENKNE